MKTFKPGDRVRATNATQNALSSAHKVAPGDLGKVVACDQHVNSGPCINWGPETRHQYSGHTDKIEHVVAPAEYVGNGPDAIVVGSVTAIPCPAPFHDDSTEVARLRKENETLREDAKRVIAHSRALERDIEGWKRLASLHGDNLSMAQHNLRRAELVEEDMKFYRRELSRYNPRLVRAHEKNWEKK